MVSASEDMRLTMRPLVSLPRMAVEMRVALRNTIEHSAERSVTFDLKAAKSEHFMSLRRVPRMYYRGAWFASAS